MNRIVGPFVTDTIDRLIDCLSVCIDVTIMITAMEQVSFDVLSFMKKDNIITSDKESYGK